MKKKILIIFLIISVICFSSCSNTSKLFNKDKPSLNYYTEKLIEELSLEKPKSIKVFYKEYFNEFTFPEIECTDILSFINILNDSNFIEKPADLPDSYKYKIYLEFKDVKYAITVFDEKYISIYKWDGSYEVDFANMSNIPIQLNLYSICKYFTEN